MRKPAAVYFAVGIVIAVTTVALGWWMGHTDFISRVRWQVTALIMLAVELVFLLFIPANKGGQQFGSQAGPQTSPLVSSGADFYDRQPSRQPGDIRWLLVAIPILLAGIAMLIAIYRATAG